MSFSGRKNIVIECGHEVNRNSRQYSQMESEPVLDHISVDGKRKYCDEQGCFREADPLSLHNKCLRHSDQRCDFADCDNLIVSHGRCELHGGVVKHCKHGQLTGDCRVCYFRGSAFCKKHGRVKSQCKDCGGGGICGVPGSAPPVLPSRHA